MPASSANTEDEKIKNYSEQISKAIHDLNNAIGPVSGYADMIRNDNRKINGDPEDPKLARRIEKIRSCVEKAGEVIERLNELKAGLQ
jgi:signal transduction histidine kinase